MEHKTGTLATHFLKTGREAIQLIAARSQTPVIAIHFRHFTQVQFYKKTLKHSDIQCYQGMIYFK
jgi:hypothetical protein